MNALDQTCLRYYKREFVISGLYLFYLHSGHTLLCSKLIFSSQSSCSLHQITCSRQTSFLKVRYLIQSWKSDGNSISFILTYLRVLCVFLRSHAICWHPFSFSYREVQINLPFPKESPLSSHISRQAMFPNPGPPEYRTKMTLPTPPPIIVNKAMGSFARREVVTPMINSRTSPPAQHQVRPVVVCNSRELYVTHVALAIWFHMKIHCLTSE